MMGNMALSLQQLLLSCAQAEPCRGLVIYPTGNTSSPHYHTYKDLYTQATRYSTFIRSFEGFREGDPVLIHFDDHFNNILWFWATLYANGVPVLSTPFSNDPHFRRRYVLGLCELLQSPHCITNSETIRLLDFAHDLRIHTANDLVQLGSSRQHCNWKLDPDAGQLPSADDLAMLMLTSGSTGSSKAVSISHGQALASVAAKAAVRKLPCDKPFLNWIGLDHVAGLLEVHLQALHVGVDQIHVSASDMVSTPLDFLRLLSDHQVSRTFAPNFFLAALVAAEGQKRHGEATQESPWDLSNLVILGSGGEANDTATAIAVSELLQRHGAPADALLPGFGMTETCAGCIYSKDCPAYDVVSSLRQVSLGEPVAGVEMRVVLEDGRKASQAHEGYLEVRGPVVTQGYYRNETATKLALSPDGWFRTGDKAIIDMNGKLCLLGRGNDVVNINGVKFSIMDLQICVKQALGSNAVTPVIFASRDPSSATEQVTVACVPEQWPPVPGEAVVLHGLLVHSLAAFTGSRPFVFAVPAFEDLPTTTLGKISLAKLRVLFERGEFADHISTYEAMLRQQRQREGKQDQRTSESERRLLDDMREAVGKLHEDFSPDMSLFDIGFNSMDLIRLKRCIDRRLNISLPVIVIIRHPTARALCKAIDAHLIQSEDGNGTHPERATLTPAEPPRHHASNGVQKKGVNQEYDPVVVLRETGRKTPLWLIHPGVGEVLVFVGLAKTLADDDRPVYALRARGFEPGQKCYGSVQEAVELYVSAVRQHQPSGPYALAGYSYGAMLAFEVAKRLPDGEVQFLGSFNLPPHIAWRMRQLTWWVEPIRIPK